MKKYSQNNTTLIIVNFNNKKYIKKCIQSINNQKIKFKQVIFVDDQSTDGSLDFIKKIRSNKIKLILTSKKTKIGSYNQMNAYHEGFLKSTGKIIYFLDSDDFFKKNKLEDTLNYFENNKKLNLILDTPLVYFNSKKKFKMKIKKRSKYLIPWVKFPSQSCFVVRRKYLNKIFKKIKINKFPDIWLDFRIILQAIIDKEEIKILNKSLTFYRQSHNMESSKFKKFSLNWWKRRKQAYSFFKYLSKKNKSKLNFSIDEYFTNIVNKFI